jgi:S-adenosylmethionine-diacylglycerol 3-amino-3-carboxypropyl transferase
MDFYQQLNYSIGNEDSAVEAQALGIKTNDRVLCVTASGDRPLNLLTTPCAHVYSVDMNHSQTYLLELKFAAINNLDYEKYLGFLGCTPCIYRESIFNEIKPYLSSEAIKFWFKHKRMLRKGVIYQGKVERLAAQAAKIFKILRPKAIKQLFLFTDLQVQREFVNNIWDHYLLRKSFSLMLHPKVVKVLSNDPGMYAYVDSAIHPGKYIYQRMLNYLQHNLASKSPLLQLVLLGKILPEAYFPYLTFIGYAQIRSKADCLTFSTDNIIDFLHRTDKLSFDAFSMSDIASYMPQEVFHRMLEGMYAAAKPDARFCIREFMSRREIPSYLAGRLQRDKFLEKKLENAEANFVYRFLVGKLDKQPIEALQI